MPFLFHYYEISQLPNKAKFLFGGTLLFAIIAGLLSIKAKLYHIILINIITILVSVVLGTTIIIPPNGSWFNPFGMKFAVILTGIVILIVELTVWFIPKAITAYKEE
ncbi:lipoprotein-releasing system transmembrane protein LolC [Oceanobacillus picturae]|jgi:hypothetical protein|uniref:Lipoprotein-releasing system transmembrane protein LolC n=1 Tax=Oceanobacillus picturae TaxID=171693 RepID=A0A0U9H4P6_9BACI|nr:hypothetical protein [Oceanobacillus picturae]GAQ17586.1 lipoprotein-releasing system transmembrane protein LolC [Oceanobacillus picturae]